jgi:hypothetical protein
MSEHLEEFIHKSKKELQEFAVTFARMIAAMAMDPHGYFEKTYAARIERAESTEEINGVLAQLVQWAASSAVSDAERERINRKLDERGLPTIAALRVHYLP